MERSGRPRAGDVRLRLRAVQSRAAQFTIVPESVIKSVKESGPVGEVLAVVLQETSKPAGLILFLSGVVALGYFGLNTVKLDRVPRQRMYVVFILTFFSMLFWAFFEQAGSSVNNFTDRNVNRVIGNTRTIDSADVGSTIPIQPTQEQLGFSNGGRVFTIDQLATMRDAKHDNPEFTVEWTVSPDNVGMRRRRTQPGDSRKLVSIDQSGLHLDVRVGVHRALGIFGQTGTRAEHARQIRPGPVAARPWFRCVLVRCAVRRWPRHGRTWRGYSSDICCRQLASFAFRPSACR